MEHHQNDQDWLGLDMTDGGRAGKLVVRPAQTNPLGNLYGGVAVAASVTMMEARARRTVTWVTVQFVSTCGAGATVDLHATVSAAGHRTSQLRVTASVDGAELFVALGAAVTGSPARRPLSGVWEDMPAVAAPEECPPFPFTRPGGDQTGEHHLLHSEWRMALGFDEPPAERVAVWCRTTDRRGLSPAVLGWQADMVGLALSKATGAIGGTSLDNTIRFVHPPDPAGEWVLLDVRAQAMVEGYGHGLVHLWSPDGTLLATGSQTCVMRTRPAGS